MTQKTVLFLHPITPQVKQVESALKLNTSNLKCVHIPKIENSATILSQNYPALIITSDAKACVNFIVSNNKIIQNTSSRIILISDKLLPDRMINKLKLMGFTENILANSPIKTIIYKIQLQLKSLLTKEQVTKAGSEGDKFVIRDYTQVIKDNPQIVKEPAFILPEDDSEELQVNEEVYELLDEQTKEIVDEFSKESDFLLEQLYTLVLQFEKEPMNTKLLDDFGQIIDRMMGSAQTIGLKDFATYCQLGKLIGYKASQSHNQVLLEIVGAILIDAVLLLKDLNKENKNGTNKVFKEDPKHKKFISRLEWLANKFKNFERGSVAVATEGSMEEAALSIEALLAKL